LITAILFAFVLGLVMYWPCLRGQIIYDDGPAIFAPDSLVAQGKIRGQIDWTDATSFIRCLTRIGWTLAMMLPPQYRIEALHLGNVVLHCVNAALTIPIAAELGANPVAVMFVYLVHPLAVSAVASMSARAAVQAECFKLLGLWCALWVHPLAALPFFACALLSKEDALGPLALIALIHPKWRNYIKGAGNVQMARAGQPVALPWRDHIPTAFVETLWRWCLWIFGIGLSTDHHYTKRRVGGLFALTLGLLCIGGFAAFHYGLIGRAALLLFWVSAFPLYWFVPTHTIVVEARAYGTLLPLALIFGLLPFVVLIPLMLIGAVYSAIRASHWCTEIGYWQHAKGEPIRMAICLGAALQNVGRLEEAEAQHRKALMMDPNCGLAWCNLALIEEAKAKHMYLEACQRLEQTGQRAEEYRQFSDYMVQACRLVEKAIQSNPKDPVLQMYYGNITGAARHFRVIR